MTTENELSRSQKLYDGLLSRLNEGEMATYEELSEALGEPFSAACRSAMLTAINRLEQHRGLTMHCVRGQGYKVSLPRQVMEIMEQRTKKAAGQLRRGVRTGSRVDITSLPSEQQQEHRMMVKAMRAMKNELNSVKRRVGLVEATVQDHESALAGHGMTMEGLLARIAALEQDRTA